MATKLNLTNEQINDIFIQYNSGVSPSIIEEQYNLKAGTVKYLRKKNNIPKYKDPKYLDLNVGQAVKDLVSGMLLKNVILKYKICESTIKRYMNKHNIIYYSDHGRKNNFNKHYFDVIDTEHKAYWLGFIYADGCISKTDKTQTRANRLIINLSSKDRIILERFLQDIEANNTEIQEFIPIGTYASYPMNRIYLNSVELCDSLQKLGVHEAKTNNILFPELYMIPENLQSHFIRGFFDGDGNISSGPTFAIIGKKEMLLPIQEILIKNCSLSKTKLCEYPYKKIEIYDLKYGGKNQVKRIFNYLYKDATIYLKRKHEKFITLLS